jgi:hypothetical protein
LAGNYERLVRKRSTHEEQSSNLKSCLHLYSCVHIRELTILDGKFSPGVRPFIDVKLPRK